MTTFTKKPKENNLPPVAILSDTSFADIFSENKPMPDLSKAYMATSLDLLQTGVNLETLYSAEDTIDVPESDYQVVSSKIAAPKPA